jgi:hypothetical protein
MNDAVDAKRYRARREHEFKDYLRDHNDLCGSPMTRDEFFTWYDEGSDAMVIHTPALPGCCKVM